MVDHEAQTAVVAAALLNLDACRLACESLTPDDFSEGPVRSIFEVMKALHLEGEPINRVTIHSYAKRNLSEPGFTIMELGNVTDAFPVVEDTPAYIKLVKDSMFQNGLKMLVSRLYTHMINDKDRDIDAWVDVFIGKYQSLERFSSALPMSSEIDGTVDQWQYVRDNWDNVPTWSLPELTDIIEPLYGGKLIICAGAAKHGKTSFMMSQGIDWARAGHGVGYFSLEMNANQLLKRQIRASTQADPVRGNMDMRIVREMLHSEFDDLPFFFNARERNLDKILTECHTLLREKGVRIFFIDHLGLLDRNMRTNTATAIGELTGKMAAFKQRHNVDIISGCQLNRDARKNKVAPCAMDLRDSGHIEQDMDVGLFIDRVAIREDDEHQDLINIIADGNRHQFGSETIVQTRWDRKTQRLVPHDD